MPGKDLLDAIDIARRRPGPAQLEEVFRIALLYSADDRACRDVLDRLTTTHRTAVAEAWAQHRRDQKGVVQVGTRWHDGPTQDGWYIVHWTTKTQFSDLRLVRHEAGECFCEIGSTMETPATAEFEGAKWMGPVERP